MRKIKSKTGRPKLYRDEHFFRSTVPQTEYLEKLLYTEGFTTLSESMRYCVDVARRLDK